ncbi:MAG: hypothetical protein WCK98_05855 [bacterium]
MGDPKLEFTRQQGWLALPFAALLAFTGVNPLLAETTQSNAVNTETPAQVVKLENGIYEVRDRLPLSMEVNPFDERGFKVTDSSWCPGRVIDVSLGEEVKLGDCVGVGYTDKIVLVDNNLYQESVNVYRLINSKDIAENKKSFLVRGLFENFLKQNGLWAATEEEVLSYFSSSTQAQIWQNIFSTLRVDINNIQSGFSTQDIMRLVEQVRSSPERLAMENELAKKVKESMDSFVQPNKIADAQKHDIKLREELSANLLNILARPIKANIKTRVPEFLKDVANIKQSDLIFVYSFLIHLKDSPEYLAGVFKDLKIEPYRELVLNLNDNQVLDLASAIISDIQADVEGGIKTYLVGQIKNLPQLRAQNNDQKRNLILSLQRYLNKNHPFVKTSASVILEAYLNPKVLIRQRAEWDRPKKDIPKFVPNIQQIVFPESLANTAK